MASHQPAVAYAAILSSSSGIPCACCGTEAHATSSCPRLWSSPFLTTKNTFLVVEPPLSDSPLGFQIWRRQISEPTLSVNTPYNDVELVQPCHHGLDKPGANLLEDEERLSLRTTMASDDAAPISGDDVHSDQELFLVRRDEKGLSPASVGSALHERRQCRPCAFVRTEVGCKEGANCRFCHLAHGSAKVRVRPCKGKRERLRRVIERLKGEVDALIAEGGSVARIAAHLSSLELPLMILENAALKKMVFAQVQAYAEEACGLRLLGNGSP